MKIKTIVITAVVVVGVGVGASFLARRSYESGTVQVEVIPVTYVNSASYSYGDSSTVSGTIISRDTQVVPLDSSHDLVGVYVQTGDRVKKGDKLLEYDMLGDELKEEMEELTKMGLELNLEAMKKDLAIMKSGRMPNSSSDGDSSGSSSVDFSSFDKDDEEEEDNNSDSSDNVDADGRSQAGVQTQGKGAVGAADPLAGTTLAGAFSPGRDPRTITRRKISYPASDPLAGMSYGTGQIGTLSKEQEEMLRKLILQEEFEEDETETDPSEDTDESLNGSTDASLKDALFGDDDSSLFDEKPLIEDDSKSRDEDQKKEKDAIPAEGESGKTVLSGVIADDIVDDDIIADAGSGDGGSDEEAPALISSLTSDTKEDSNENVAVEKKVAGDEVVEDEAALISSLSKSNDEKSDDKKSDDKKTDDKKNGDEKSGDEKLDVEELDDDDEIVPDDGQDDVPADDKKDNQPAIKADEPQLITTSAGTGTGTRDLGTTITSPSGVEDLIDDENNNEDDKEDVKDAIFEENTDTDTSADINKKRGITAKTSAPSFKTPVVNDNTPDSVDETVEPKTTDVTLSAAGLEGFVEAEDDDKTLTDTGKGSDASSADTNKGPEAGSTDTNKEPEAGSNDTNKEPEAGSNDTNKEPEAGSNDTGKGPEAGSDDTNKGPEAEPTDTGKGSDAAPSDNDKKDDVTSPDKDEEKDDEKTPSDDEEDEVILDNEVEEENEKEDEELPNETKLSAAVEASFEEIVEGDGGDGTGDDGPADGGTGGDGTADDEVGDGGAADGGTGGDDAGNSALIEESPVDDNQQPDAMGTDPLPPNQSETTKQSETQKATEKETDPVIAYDYVVPVQVGELETNFEGNWELDDEVAAPTTSIIADVNSFLSRVNAITLALSGGWDGIGGQIGEIEALMELFRNSFADEDEFQKNDLFGETVTVKAYTVNGDVIKQVGNTTADVMQQAYDRLCGYHFVHSMLALNPGQTPSAMLDPTWATQNEEAIRALVSEYAALPDSLRIYNPATGAFEFSSQFGILNEGIFNGELPMDFLRNTILSVNSNYVMQEPTEEVPVVSTEGRMLSDLTDYDDEGSGYSAEELAEAIREQEKNIKETELQIREAELGIKEYKKILDGKVVYATMDGIVKNAGSMNSSSSGSAFITITGKEGLYVKGSVNELALDTVHVGDTITGTNYSTGSTFTAEIVEISQYPDTSSNNYYGYGDENTNSSYYPFLAYIENAEGLDVDSYVDLSLDQRNAQASVDATLSSGLSLDEYFVRTDENGRSFCYVRGTDGLLEKRYLEIGANNWGVISIKSGLTQSDCIAFPYGDGVEAGAQTVVVDSLTAVDGDFY